MAMLFLNDDHTRLKTYSASTKGAVSTIRVEIEVTDPMRLGFLLSELAEIVSEQKARKAATAKSERKTEKKPQLALAAPLLRLAHRGDE